MKSAQGEQLGWRPLEITVVAVGCLIVANHLLAGALLLSVNKFNAQLDLAGAQRMLSQRVLLLGREYQLRAEPELGERLRVSIERMRTEHEVLLNGGDRPGVPQAYQSVKPVEGTARELLAEFRADLLPYLNDVEQILDNPSAPLPSLDRGQAVLSDAHAIVQALESTAIARNKMLLVMEIGLGIVETLLIVVVIYKFIRRLRRDSDTVTGELRHRSKLLLNLYEQSPLMQYSVDAKWRIVRVNRAWMDTMGYERDEVIGQSSRLFICPEMFDETVHSQVTLMAAADDRDRLQNFRIDLVTKSGERRHCLVAMRLHTKSDGEFVGADILCMDESDRLRTKRDLQSANAALAESFRNMPIPLFRCAADGALLEANSAMLREFEARTLRELDRERIESIIRDAIGALPESGEKIVQGIPATVRRRDGSTASILVSLRQVRVPDDTDVTIEGALIDVSELERVKRLVKRSRRRFQDLYDSTPVMLYSIDARGNVEDINDHMLDRIGRSRHEIIGTDGGDLVTDEDREAATEAMRRTVMRGSRLTHDCTFLVAGGATIAARLTAVPRMHADGSYAGAHLCVLDMSEVEAANEERDKIAGELQTSQKLEAIGQLAAGIAHEINTPAQYVTDNLQFVCGAMSELLAYVQRPDSIDDAAAVAAPDIDLEFLAAELPPALSEAEDGMRQIKSIVQAMKDFSHPGGLEKESVDLNRLIDSVVTVTRNEWKYVADVETELDATLPSVICSGSEINQVLLNMIVNSAHAMEEHGNGDKGRIVISSKRDGGTVIVRISDDGSGIPADVLPNIFNPFFTTKEVGKGTGQGLAIAHRIISEHDGTIQVASEVGSGTTFTIRLPIHAEANAA